MNKLFILLGKTASGKDTILTHTLQYIDQHNLPIKRLISNTTRPKRKAEQEGLEYHFSTLHEFDTLYKQNKIIEYATYKVKNDNWIYYTTKKDCEALKGYNCISVKNPIGFIQLNQYLKNQIVTILIECPTEIRKERYMKRGALADKFDDREKRDIDAFMYFNPNYIITNDGTQSLDEITQQIINIINKESR